MSAAKRAWPLLGVPSRVRELVDVLAGCTRAADWDAGRPIAWPSNAYLSEVLGVQRSQLKALVRRALELGLIEVRDAPNGQRRANPGRDPDDAYGFELWPLIARREEFEQLAAAAAERRREGARLRRQIGSAKARLLSLIDLATTIGATGDWHAVEAEAFLLAERRRDSFDPTHLAPIAQQLGALVKAAEAALTPCVDVNPSVETDPVGAMNRPPNTPTTDREIAKASTRADGPRRPAVFHNEKRSATEPRKGAHEPEALVGTGNRRERRVESALRGFVVTPAFLTEAVPGLALRCASPTPGWQEIFDAAWRLRAELGISPHAWGQACSLLGRTEAVAALAVIAVRTDAGLVRSPGGLLRRMVERHTTGELRLDRSLFGLADGLKAKRLARRQSHGPRSPMQERPSAS